ncbi:hypothetical protein [Ureibacillus sinduriensis]|uniref:hypothetical protein n=1 Tax=Ureibacillus sinduriensis TaxID=561440 RepID=UPI000AE7BDE2|nr:hypothetical protein [Ureibacillus sinduriensis]
MIIRTIDLRDVAAKFLEVNKSVDEFVFSLNEPGEQLTYEPKEKLLRGFYRIPIQ